MKAFLRFKNLIEYNVTFLENISLEGEMLYDKRNCMISVQKVVANEYSKNEGDNNFRK